MTENFWTADGSPGWSADGSPGWSADGAIGAEIGSGAGVIPTLVGLGAGLVFPVNVLAGGSARRRRPIEVPIEVIPIEGTAAARLVALKARGVGRVEDPPVPVVVVAHGVLAPFEARAKGRHGVRGKARGIAPSVLGRAIAMIGPAAAARGRARQQVVVQEDEVQEEEV